MTRDNARSRRRVLQLAGAGAVGTLTGCLGLLSGSEPTVFKDITFQEESVVVHLTDETDADAIDLRSPTDELVDTVSVRRQSMVTFPLYATTDTPYPPGTYTLVAVTTNDTGESQRISTRAIELTMSLSITDVRTVTTSFGATIPPKVQVTVTNTGRLPIKITYIGFPTGVPSPDPPPAKADTPVAGFVSTSDTGQLAPVGTTTTFETHGSPLRFDGTPTSGGGKEPSKGASWAQLTRNYCNGEQANATLVVVPKYGHPHRRTVKVTYAGSVDRRSAGPGFFCTNTTVDRVERTNTTATTHTANREGND